MNARPSPTKSSGWRALYGQPVSHFVRYSEPVPDFQPHFPRGFGEGEARRRGAVGAAIGEFQRFVEDYLDLEQRMKGPRSARTIPPVVLNPHVNVGELAEDVAPARATAAGFGDQPISDLRSLLESDVACAFSSCGYRVRSRGCTRSSTGWEGASS